MGAANSGTDLDLQAIAARIRAARLALKLSQGHLAKAAEVTPMTVYRWEAALARPDADNLVRLAEVLRRSERWILTGEDDDTAVVPRPAAAHGANPYPAWLEFLKTPEAAAAPDWQVWQLEPLRFTGEAPTVLEYQMLLRLTTTGRPTK